jgi:hypothetical protein
MMENRTGFKRGGAGIAQPCARGCDINRLKRGLHIYLYWHSLEYSPAEEKHLSYHSQY